MKVAFGKVVAGKVVVEGDALREGATVTILAPEDDESFELASEDEAELVAALEEADAGHFVSTADLLRHIGRH